VVFITHSSFVHSRKVDNLRTHVSGSGSPLLLQSAEPWRHVRCSRASALPIFSKIPFRSTQYSCALLHSPISISEIHEEWDRCVRSSWGKLTGLFCDISDSKTTLGGYMLAACKNGRDKDGPKQTWYDAMFSVYLSKKSTASAPCPSFHLKNISQCPHVP
jgi:hypothetical protein